MSPLICYSSCYVIPCSLQLRKKNPCPLICWIFLGKTFTMDYGLLFVVLVFYSHVPEQIIGLLQLHAATWLLRNFHAVFSWKEAIQHWVCLYACLLPGTFKSFPWVCVQMQNGLYFFEELGLNCSFLPNRKYFSKVWRYMVQDSKCRCSQHKF